MWRKFDMPSANSLFDPSAFTTLAGSAALVWAIVNGIRTFIGFYKKWLILVVSFLVTLAALSFSTFSWSLQPILLVIGNTFLLAFTAAGAQETITKGGAAPEGEEQGGRTYRWFESWFD
jgi:hypothetical protein